jgi:hypothetical protein
MAVKLQRPAAGHRVQSLLADMVARLFHHTRYRSLAHRGDQGNNVVQQN